MDEPVYLIFGDLHGRVLPAFRLASVWACENGRAVAGILQVGDLGYFPDLTRMDKATRRHAADDLTELGVQDIIRPNALADAVFGDPDCPPVMWFTAGNHEDFDSLLALASASGRQNDFVVDHHARVRCIKNGRVVQPTPCLGVGALWGVDGEGTNRRRNLPPAAYVSQRRADELLAGPAFQVLLTHDSPLGAKRDHYGSEIIRTLIGLAEPAFAFFGHYHGEGRRAEGDFGTTQVYHLSGFELSGRGGTAEPGSVGVITWSDGAGSFDYIDGDWLKTFTRHNWKYR